jgi:hypothetical protein
MSRIGLNLGLISIAAILPVQATNLIVDGNFSQGNPTIPNTQAGYWAVPTANGGLGAPGGWNVEFNGTSLDCLITDNSASLVTASSGDVCGTAEAQNWGFNYSIQNPISGNYFAMDASGNYNGPLYQTISGLTVGQQYVLTFYSATDQQYGYSQTINANWGVDAYAGSAAPPLGFSGNYTAVGALISPSNNQTWTQETYNFSATSMTETIAFLAESAYGSGPPFALLSNISLTATPEPGTFLLLGLGMLGIPVLYKIRKKKD